MAMTEPMRNPTLEAIEDNASKTCKHAAALKENLYSLLNDLGYQEPSGAAQGETSAQQSAIIGRICDTQSHGVDLLMECDRLAVELRRQLFSVPINAKAASQPHSTYRGERAERIA